MNTSEQNAETFIAALDKRVVEYTAQHGKRPLYYKFGYTTGAKYCRIFFDMGNGRSALAFVDSDGNVYRSDSWKQRGRLLGKMDSDDALNYIVHR